MTQIADCWVLRGKWAGKFIELTLTVSNHGDDGSMRDYFGVENGFKFVRLGWRSRAWIMRSVEGACSRCFQDRHCCLWLPWNATSVGGFNIMLRSERWAREDRRWALGQVPWPLLPLGMTAWEMLVHVRRRPSTFEYARVPCLFSIQPSSIEHPVIAFLPGLSRLEQARQPLK